MPGHLFFDWLFLLKFFSIFLGVSPTRSKFFRRRVRHLTPVRHQFVVDDRPLLLRPTKERRAHSSTSFFFLVFGLFFLLFSIFFMSAGTSAIFLFFRTVATIGLSAYENPKKKKLNEIRSNSAEFRSFVSHDRSIFFCDTKLFQDVSC